MVGPGEVDEELQPEVVEECAKYGEVVKVIIYEVRFFSRYVRVISPYSFNTPSNRQVMRKKKTTTKLQSNPPEVQVTIGYKRLCQDYLHHIANFCATVLNIFSKGIINSNDTDKCGKRILKFI